jgi:AcrR family transcriptional regulator
MAANEGDAPGTEDAANGAHRGPGRPRDPGYDKAILDATLEILNDKGYAGLTIDGVAAKTGVGRPTIYRRWRSKPALVIAALTAAPSLSPAPDTGSLRDDLLVFQRDQVAMMDRPESRRITAGLVADLVDDPELAEAYLGD